MKKKITFIIMTLVLAFSTGVAPASAAMNAYQQRAIERLQAETPASAAHVSQLSTYFLSNPGQTREQVEGILNTLQAVYNFLGASTVAGISDPVALARELQLRGGAGVQFLSQLLNEMGWTIALDGTIRDRNGSILFRPDAGDIPMTGTPAPGNQAPGELPTTGTAQQGASPTVTLPNTGNNFTSTYVALASVALLTGIALFFATKKKAYEAI